MNRFKKARFWLTVALAAALSVAVTQTARAAVFTGTDVYRLEAGEDTTVSNLMAVLGALGLAIRLERAGLPTARDVASRFQDDDDDAS